MLTPSGGARSNCYKFISWVTGCSHSTIGRVNEQMKETGKCFFFSITTRVYLNIVLGNIYLKVFRLGLKFSSVMLRRVVTKISSCRVFVVSSRGSHKQSWSPFPPPTSPKKVSKCSFYRSRKGITAPKKQSSSRVQLSLAVL